MVSSTRHDAVPGTNKTPPPSHDPSHTPCSHDRVGGVYFALQPSRALTEKIEIFHIVVRTLIPNRDSHFPSWEQRAL
jgi:hypothetical protein